MLQSADGIEVFSGYEPFFERTHSVLIVPRITHVIKLEPALKSLLSVFGNLSTVDQRAANPLLSQHFQEARRENRQEYKLCGCISAITEKGMTPMDNPNTSNVLIKLSADDDFIAVSTYCRNHGHRGRSLILRDGIKQVLSGNLGTLYDSDCGNNVSIHNYDNRFHLTFDWLTEYSDGTLKGFRQRIEVPCEVFVSGSPSRSWGKVSRLASETMVQGFRQTSLRTFSIASSNIAMNSKIKDWEQD